MFEEKKIKQDLVNAYKILAKLKLDDHTYTHLSARIGDAFFIYPFGLRFEEVTEQNLMKISFDGEVLEGCEYQYNETGYKIHGNIYKNRSDLNFIFHLHTSEIVAVSANKKGLLPISQWALHFYGQIAYHEYNSLVLDEGQASDLIKDLGDKKIMLMKNHGSLTCGGSVYEAMFFSYHLQKACETQCFATKSESDLVFINDDVAKKSNKDILSFEKDLGKRDWEAWLRWIEK